MYTVVEITKIASPLANLRTRNIWHAPLPHGRGSDFDPVVNRHDCETT